MSRRWWRVVALTTFVIIALLHVLDRNEADEVLREAVAEDGSGLFIVRSSERTGGTGHTTLI